MSRTTVLPALVAAAALVALPAAAAAQTSAPDPQAPAGAPSQETTAQPTNDTPRTHLDKAKQALDRIESGAVTGAHASQLNELRREIDALERSYPASSVPGSATGDVSRSTTGRERAAGAQDDWSTHLMAAQRTLDELLGESAVGTSGTGRPEPDPSAAAGASATIDASVKAQLQQVRQHLTQFAAMAGAASAGGAADATMGAQTPPTGSAAQTTQTQTTTTTTQTTGTTTQAQVDADAAREHLTQARQALADLTALPQAQQLQGETRTQVSQLISQFNTLITTKEDWQESYTQVEQTLNALLSGAAAPSPTGTTGTAGAAEPLDPALRSKLEEFRTHLHAFHAAAGAPADAPAASPAPSGGTAGLPSGTTAGASADAETHIAAIERIVNEALGTAAGSTGTAAQPGATATTGATASGQVTIDRAKLEQIRTHLQQLRDAIQR